MTINIQPTYKADELMEAFSGLSDEELKAELEANKQVLKLATDNKEIATAFRNLKENEDFRIVFEKGLFKNEVERINELIVGKEDYVPSNLKREQVENLVDKLLGIRHLKIFFVELDIKLDGALQNIVDAELAIKELKKEMKKRKIKIEEQ